MLQNAFASSVSNCEKEKLLKCLKYSANYNRYFCIFNFYFSFADDDDDDDEVKNMRILYAQQCENINFQFMTSEK